MAAKALALVRPHLKRESNSVSFIPPLKRTLTPLENRKAVRLVSTRLERGWIAYWKPRKYGKGYSIPNWCPKCGKTARELIKEANRDYEIMSSPQIRTFMFSHAVVRH